MSTEWCSFAIRWDGPAWKQGYRDLAVNTLEGIVDHSAEGSLPACLSELDKPHRYASWWATVAKNGRIYQHYPLTAITWHAGSREANRRFVGVEHEGRAGEPLTEAQYQATLQLHRWLWVQMGLGTPERRVNLWEHLELAGTACPSARIPWSRLITDLKEVEMSEQDKLELTLRQGAARLQKKLADLDFQAVVNDLAWLGVRAA